MDLIVKPEQTQVKDIINPALLKDKPSVQKEIKAPQVELSENIQKFDKKPRVYTQNPYDYNSISLKKTDDLTPSASEMVLNPVYNLAGKALGVDMAHDWNRYYDKVKILVDWAKKETGYSDANKISEWIYAQLKKAPSIGPRKIDDLYIYSRLKTDQKPKVKTKIVVKKVYIKQKMSQDEMLKKLIWH